MNEDDPYSLIEASKADALTFLQGIYNDPSEPKSLRVKCASIAIEYERPRLELCGILGDEAIRRRGLPALG